VSAGSSRVVAITGASSGIGAATAEAVAEAGFTTFLGARRVDRLAELADRSGGTALALDVTDAASIDGFVSEIRSRARRLDVLINNAGVAYGRDRVEQARDDDWDQMWQTNVLGVMRITRACLPMLRQSAGHIVNIGSVTSFEVYPGGAGYAATKWGVRALTQTLRLELNGEPIRVTEIDPGLTETEFSVVRFRGDEARAAKVYEGSGALQPADVAECVLFVITRPAHVDIDELVVRPVTQATAYLMNGRPAW
jgi:NADP-dependent 3-hydroxy acid dehydrogenase YdfG